jgi:hypothetical protein
MNCPICGIVASNRFCPTHEMAYKNLLSAYEVWHQAIEISWRDYLERIKDNSNTGKWVKEVCTLMLNEGGEK